MLNVEVTWLCLTLILWPFLINWFYPEIKEIYSLRELFSLKILISILTSFGFSAFAGFCALLVPLIISENKALTSSIVNLVWFIPRFFIGGWALAWILLIPFFLVAAIWGFAEDIAYTFGKIRDKIKKK